MRTEHTLVEFTFAYYPKGSKVLRKDLEIDECPIWKDLPENILNDAKTEYGSANESGFLQMAVASERDVDAEFIEDGICLCSYQVVSGNDGHYGCNLQADLDNATIGDVFDMEEVFGLATEKWKELNALKIEKERNETLDEAIQISDAGIRLLKEVPVILRVLAIYSYRTWRDDYSGEFDCECSFDRVITVSELIQFARKV